MAEDLQIAIISTCAALLGSVVGGIISFFTTRDATMRQWKQSLVLREIERKEALYSDFIGECAQKLLSALDKKESGGATFAHLYTLLGKIRMMSSEKVRIAAEQLANFSTEAHAVSNKKDGVTGLPIFEARNRFTEIARAELDEIKNGA